MEGARLKAHSCPLSDKRRRHSRRPCERGDTARSQIPPDVSHGDSGRVYSFSPPPSGNLHGSPGRQPSELLPRAGFPCGSLNSPSLSSNVSLPGKGSVQPEPDSTTRGEKALRATEQRLRGSRSSISRVLLFVLTADQKGSRMRGCYHKKVKHQRESIHFVSPTYSRRAERPRPASCDTSGKGDVTPMVFPRRHFCPRCGRRQRMWSSRSPRLVPIPGGFQSSHPRSKAGG
jgi:hypothetical protein